MTKNICPQCNHPIDDFLDSCPFCGCPKSAFEAVEKGKQELAKRKEAAKSFWDVAKETLSKVDFQTRVSFESMPENQHLHSVEYWLDEKNKLEALREENMKRTEQGKDTHDQSKDYEKSSGVAISKNPISADLLVGFPSRKDKRLAEKKANLARQEREHQLAIERKEARREAEKKRRRGFKQKSEEDKKKEKAEEANIEKERKILADLAAKFTDKMTRVHSESLGDGYVSRILRNNGCTYLLIDFGGHENTFGYPECFEKGYLSLGKTTEVIPTDPFEKYHYQENQKEKAYFEETLSEALRRSEATYKAPPEHKYPVQLYDESLSADDFFDEIETNTVQSSWRDIANEVFFGKTVVAGKSQYFGKAEIPGYVLSWADPAASSYYQWNILVHQKDSPISVVRKFTLGFRLYRDFVDLFKSSYLHTREEFRRVLNHSRIMTMPPYRVAISKAFREASAFLRICRFQG
jgi:hypothetical protein